MSGEDVTHLFLSHRRRFRFTLRAHAPYHQHEHDGRGVFCVSPDSKSVVSIAGQRAARVRRGARREAYFLRGGFDRHDRTGVSADVFPDVTRGSAASRTDTTL